MISCRPCPGQSALYCCRSRACISVATEPAQPRPNTCDERGETLKHPSKSSPVERPQRFIIEDKIYCPLSTQINRLWSQFVLERLPLGQVGHEALGPVPRVAKLLLVPRNLNSPNPTNLPRGDVYIFCKPIVRLRDWMTQVKCLTLARRARNLPSSPELPLRRP